MTPIRAQTGRDAVLINGDDAIALGAADGTPVLLRSDSGEMAGLARIAPVTRGTLQVHWPEGEVLFDRSRCATRPRACRTTPP